MKDKILKTIKSFSNITFIWKYETPEDNHGLGDLLNDERLTLFIANSGMGSTTEVAFSNVSALAISVFGDQKRNAKLLKSLEIGLAAEKGIL
uniref:glucuronosyltransferase n=1 Tax=Strongyloides venezuelensis TaxID=75913 RepID=A0A0K0FHW4_STRVS